jgi:WD40 repeat protein
MKMSKANTMQKVILVVEITGTGSHLRIQVDLSTSVGACVASLIEKLRFPEKDATGRPMVYHLRPVGSQQPWPNAERFGTFHIYSGMHVVLEVEGTSNTARPVKMLGLPVPLPISQGVARRWSRRAFLALTLTGCSVAGLGTGAATAFAQRSLLARSNSVPHGSQPFATTMPRGANLQFTFTRHQPQTVRVVGWSPDGTMLASGGDDAQAIIWKPTGTIQQQITHSAPVQTLAWSPESQRIMTGAGTQVAFFKALTGGHLASSTHSHVAAVTSVAWTARNQMQAVSGGMDKQAIVWNTVRFQPQTIFTRHTAAINAVSWGSDEVVASASQGGVVRVWNPETGQEGHGFYQDAQVPMLACVFAPVGSSLAVGGSDGIARVWRNGFLCQHQQGNTDPICQDTPLRLKTSNQPIRSLAWSPDARYLASGSDDGAFTVWGPVQSKAPLFTVTIAAGIAVHSLAWSPDGSQIAAASSGMVTIWSLHA